METKTFGVDSGERFNVELIISTFIGRNRDRPRILVADPDFDDLAKLYDSANNRFFRLRHYSRVLQFVGLPKSAFLLNRYALDYLKGYRDVGRTILNEKESDGFLTTETFHNDRYFGRWFESVVSEGSKRYRKDRYGKSFLARFGGNLSRKVFQGMREDVYRAGFAGEPFTQELLTREEIEASLHRIGRPASVFPDGTVQIFSESD